jgi:4-hydroxy-tetrahydrodipicolinate synthase
MVTPMQAGEIDHEGLRALVEFHVARGTHGLVPCGTTGESATFSHDEHKRVVETVVEAAAGRLEIMAGTGSNSTREAVDLTRHAQATGADGALVITPYYNKPTQGGLRRHFEAVAEAAPGFPICLYNVPGRTAVDLAPETAAEIAASCSTVCAIKEASGDVERVTTLRRLAPSLDVFSGDDGLTLAMLALGARGVVSVTGNLVPERMMAMLAAFERGDVEAARSEHEALHPLMKAMFVETNPIPVKAALALLGHVAEDFRLPLVRSSEATRVALRAILTELGELSGEGPSARPR